MRRWYAAAPRPRWRLIFLASVDEEIDRQARHVDPHREHAARQRQLRRSSAGRPLVPALVTYSVRRSSPPKQGMVGHCTGTATSSQQLAGRRELQQAPAFEHRAPSSCPRRRPRRRRAGRRSPGCARLPAGGLGVELVEHAVARACALACASQSQAWIAWLRRVGPVHGRASGDQARPLAVVASAGLQLDQRLAAAGRCPGGSRCSRARRCARVARLVHRAGPEAAQRVGLAVVEARGGRCRGRSARSAASAPPQARAR